jgi:hypothetical protein
VLGVTLGAPDEKYGPYQVIPTPNGDSDIAGLYWHSDTGEIIAGIAGFGLILTTVVTGHDDGRT